MSTPTETDTAAPAYRQALESAIADVVAPAAARVDRDASFPRESIDALSAAGVLGLISAADVGGSGLGLRAAADVVERLAGACGSTAMVVLMHYSGTQVLEAHGAPDVRQAVAAGRHLTTLAFSESGSRSHFWAPLSTATRDNGHVVLNAQKSWVTSAGHADSYVWSSRPTAGDGPMTLWFVPSQTAGLSQPSGFDGLGLRGNSSTPITATNAAIPASAMLGDDGSGLDYALGLVLPTFQVLSAAFSLGLLEAVVAETATHLQSTRLEHMGQTLAQVQTVRMDFARMRVETDKLRALLLDTLAALESQRADAMLRVLESKAVGAETAVLVTDLAMKVAGGAAFRKELGIERRFRDSRAARVMAPTSDALLDFIGRATLGLPLLEDPVAR